MDDSLTSIYSNKRIAVTGAAGTIGSEIIHQLTEAGAQEIRALDNSESELFFLGEKTKDQKNVNSYLVDIRDYGMLRQHFTGVDYVIHAAAYKHVPLCEKSPRLAIEVNIEGSNNVVNAARENDVERVLFTSSDKAVNPTNVMGASKLIGERIFTSANFLGNGTGESTLCGSTRFGNVLGSRGSVIPLFKKQIEKGGPVTVTDASMTRFMMSIQEATALVLKSLSLFKGGEVFVTKMPVFNILDLAEVMIANYAPTCGYRPDDIHIEMIGMRIGEKLYEELTTIEETSRSRDIGEMIVIEPHVAHQSALLPRISWKNTGDPLKENYISHTQPLCSRDQISDFLHTWKVF